MPRAQLDATHSSLQASCSDIPLAPYRDIVIYLVSSPPGHYFARREVSIPRSATVCIEPAIHTYTYIIPARPFQDCVRSNWCSTCAPGPSEVARNLVKRPRIYICDAHIYSFKAPGQRALGQRALGHRVSRWPPLVFPCKVWISLRSLRSDCILFKTTCADTVYPVMGFLISRSAGPRTTVPLSATT